MRLVDATRDYEFRDPPLYRLIFANAMMAPVWLLVRAYLGWSWLNAGVHKIEGNGWINNNGAALEGFWKRIVVVPEKGNPPISYDWYRDFIQFMLDNGWHTWFAYLIAFGEVAIGIALIVGFATGFAALAGATMNFNFMMAGTASTNPVLFALAILLLLGWKVAGRIGLDRWLLPALGTPWGAGRLVAHEDARRAGGAGLATP